jgi:hypothetical protein
MQEIKDICLSCGKEHEEKFYNPTCTCPNPHVVHRIKCNGCNNLIGYINDDPGDGLEEIYCSNCLNKK